MIDFILSNYPFLAFFGSIVVVYVLRRNNPRISYGDLVGAIMATWLFPLVLFAGFFIGLPMLLARGLDAIARHFE